MDYFKQRRAYRQWKQNEGTIARGQNDVYRELLDYANDEGHLDGFFKLRNSALVDWTGLTLQGVIKARNELANLGLIEFKKGIRNKTTPQYKIVPLYYTKTPQSVHKEFNSQFTKSLTAGSPTVEQPVEHKDLLVLDKDKTKTISPPTPAGGRRKDPTGFEEVWAEYSHTVRHATGINADARKAYNDAILSGETTKEQVLQKIGEYRQYCDLNGRGEAYRMGAARWFGDRGWLTDYDLSKTTEQRQDNAKRKQNPRVYHNEDTDWSNVGTPEGTPW